MRSPRADFGTEPSDDLIFPMDEDVRANGSRVNSMDDFRKAYQSQPTTPYQSRPTSPRSGASRPGTPRPFGQGLRNVSAARLTTLPISIPAAARAPVKSPSSSTPFSHMLSNEADAINFLRRMNPDPTVQWEIEAVLDYAQRALYPDRPHSDALIRAALDADHVCRKAMHGNLAANGVAAARAGMTFAEEQTMLMATVGFKRRYPNEHPDSRAQRLAVLKEKFPAYPLSDQN